MASERAPSGPSTPDQLTGRAGILPPARSPALLEGIVQLASEGIISIDADSRILLFNGGAEEIFGYTADEVLGQRLDLLIPQRYRAVHEAKHLPDFAKAHATSRRMGERREVFGLRKNGEEFPAEISISRVDVEGRRIYNAVVRDASERKAYEAALKERIDVAQKATYMRDEVLGVVAHDLRNPLSTVKMCASALASGAATSAMPPQAAERVAELTGVIMSSAEWMERIIRDLLDVTAIEAGRLSVAPVPLPVEEVLDAVAGMYGPHADEAGVGLAVEAENGPPPVMADVDRLLQAVGNLVSNAIRFTPAGGRVTVTAVETGDRRVRFEVADTGPGIPREQVPFLFDRFWQARAAIRAGAGLGLAIAKGIAEVHGGAIGVDTEVGTGSRFWIDIPLA